MYVCMHACMHPSIHPYIHISIHTYIPRYNIHTGIHTNHAYRTAPCQTIRYHTILYPAKPPCQDPTITSPCPYLISKTQYPRSRPIAIHSVQFRYMHSNTFIAFNTFHDMALHSTTYHYNALHYITITTIFIALQSYSILHHMAIPCVT